MALCYRQCPDCPMMVTVRIDVPEYTKKKGDCVVDLRHSTITEIFQKMVNDPLHSGLKDVAIILRVGNVDVAAMCSFCADKDEEELF